MIMLDTDEACKGRSRPTKPHDLATKYKTELCRNWEEGHCEYGEKCTFAHGSYELRPKTHLSTAYKTKNCKQFFDLGFCSYGPRCQFRHQDETFTSAELAVSVTRCMQDQRGRRLPVFVELEGRCENCRLDN